MTTLTFSKKLEKTLHTSMGSILAGTLVGDAGAIPLGLVTIPIIGEIAFGAVIIFPIVATIEYARLKDGQQALIAGLIAAGLVALPLFYGTLLALGTIVLLSEEKIRF